MCLVALSTRELHLGRTDFIRRGVLLLLFSLALTAQAQPNSYTLGSSWFWDDTISWSLGIRPTTNHWVFITNANTKTVTLNNVAAAIPGTMTVSNVKIGRAHV